MAKTKKQPGIRDRVKELRRVRAGDIVPNDRNWRTHPEEQRAAMQGVLHEIGYADALLARELPDGTLALIDGHLRAETTPDMLVPVLVLDVTEAEADKLLLTLDPLAAMAGADAVKLDELLREVETGSEALAKMLADLAGDSGLYEVDGQGAPSLPDGDREPFQQMTFTLHDSQVDVLKQAMDAAKGAGPFDGSPNANSNGNALARIAEAYCGAS